jgi:FkbM family methyltransferase
MEKHMNRIEQLFSYKKYIIFGATSSAENSINFLNKHKKEVLYILDNDSNKVNKIFNFKYTIKSPDILRENFDNKTAIIISSAYQMEIFEQLKTQYNIPTENIFPYIDEMVYDVYSHFDYTENELIDIYNLLEDTPSKEYFLSLLKFRKTLNLQDIRPLQQCKEQYIHYNIRPEKVVNSIVDIGAYNGDSLKTFNKHFPHTKKIFCLEPMQANFQELVKNIKEWKLGKAIALQFAIGDKDDEKVQFDEDFTLNSTAHTSKYIEDSSGNYVLTKTLDSLFTQEDIDLIKMDIEGYELKAIDGAKNIIKNQTPHLIISAYHASDHIVKIVHQILNYNKNYSLYCMHHPLAIHEIEYYFVNNKSKSGK